MPSHVRLDIDPRGEELRLRGRGVGTAAHRLLVDYLFTTTTTHRIWAGTEIDNIAEQRALERCGFLPEGRLRGRHFRAASGGTAWSTASPEMTTRRRQRPSA